MPRSSRGQRAQETTVLPRANKSTTGVDRKTFGSQQVNRVMEKNRTQKLDLLKAEQTTRDYVNDQRSKLDDLLHGGS